MQGRDVRTRSSPGPRRPDGCPDLRVEVRGVPRFPNGPDGRRAGRRRAAVARPRGAGPLARTELRCGHPGRLERPRPRGGAEPEAHRSIAAAFLGAMCGVSPLVLRRERPRRLTLVNAITEDWRRRDLVLVPPADFAEQKRARDTLGVLLDRDGLHDRLPETPPPRTRDPGRWRSSVEEFIRVLGLLPVGLGRGEPVLPVRGAGLRRDLLTADALGRGGGRPVGRRCPGRAGRGAADPGGPLLAHRASGEPPDPRLDLQFAGGARPIEPG